MCYIYIYIIMKNIFHICNILYKIKMGNKVSCMVAKFFILSLQTWLSYGLFKYHEPHEYFADSAELMILISVNLINWSNWEMASTNIRYYSTREEEWDISMSRFNLSLSLSTYLLINRQTIAYTLMSIIQTCSTTRAFLFQEN